jgi:hypothetical protein
MQCNAMQCNAMQSLVEFIQFIISKRLMMLKVDITQRHFQLVPVNPWMVKNIVRKQFSL